MYDRASKSRIPCRLIFVFSTAGKKAAEEARKKNVRRVHKNMEALQQSVANGCRNTDEQSIKRRAATALGSGQASKYFTWQIVPIFLHKPQRVEALVFILTIALMIYYLVQHEYRRNLPSTASPKQRRTTK